MTFSKSKAMTFLGLMIFIFISCETEGPRTKLNSEEIKMVDSLYSKGLKEARKEADYICQELRDSLYQEYIDSILELRLIEVDQIIND